MQLPISVWRRRCDAGSFDEVGEAGEASPYDGGSRWRVGRAVEITSEARDGPDIELQVVRCLALSVRRCVFKQVALVIREDRSRIRSRCRAAEHRQPRYAPGHDAAQRDAVGQAIRRGQAQFLDPAPGFESPEEGLDLPAQRVPFEMEWLPPSRNGIAMCQCRGVNSHTMERTAK